MPCLPLQVEKLTYQTANPPSSPSCSTTSENSLGSAPKRASAKSCALDCTSCRERSNSASSQIIEKSSSTSSGRAGRMVPSVATLLLLLRVGLGEWVGGHRVGQVPVPQAAYTVLDPEH